MSVLINDDNASETRSQSNDSLKPNPTHSQPDHLTRLCFQACRDKRPKQETTDKPILPRRRSLSSPDRRGGCREGAAGGSGGSGGSGGGDGGGGGGGEVGFGLGGEVGE